ncbi:MAG: Radical SAM domain protein [Parcubacteria group bacterium GW2011_GWA2_31_28]|nr:MAG: Radical SAM domain protein [Parcubacteria group bacterium GW2011_GWA2_31_28]
MPLNIERGRRGNGIQIVRSVVDTIDSSICNLACQYCDNKTKNLRTKGGFLPANTIQQILSAADEQSQLDVVLSGGEITMHPEWERVVDATHILNRTGTTLITNGYLLDEQKAKQIRDSKISRVCISLDGATAEVHGYARGKTFEKVMRGLHLLQNTGKNIAVLSVVHQGNVDHVIELSQFLADNKLANQHHLAALYYSGSARDNWRKLIVPIDKMMSLQQDIDTSFDDFQKRGLFILFNHYWPLTGLRPKSGNPRELLSHQLGEQNKATWAVVRSNGDINATTAFWGRESVNDPRIGNLDTEPAEVLFGKLDTLYRSGTLLQLPREVEAKRKFIVEGVFDHMLAETVLGTGDERIKQDIQLIPCKPMSELDVMQTPIDPKYIDQIATLFLESPNKYRIVQHTTGVYLFYDNATAHVILLNEGELGAVQSRIDALQSTIIS